MEWQWILYFFVPVTLIKIVNAPFGRSAALVLSIINWRYCNCTGIRQVRSQTWPDFRKMAGFWICWTWIWNLVELCSKLPGVICYRAKRSAARYCLDKLSVCLSICLSVRLSVTLVDCDHMRWNSSEIISQLISLTFLLSADPNITDLLRRERP